MEERKREGERKRGSDVFEDGTGEEEGERVFNSFLHASATGCRTHTRMNVMTLHMQPTRAHICTNVPKIVAVVSMARY